MIFRFCCKLQWNLSGRAYFFLDMSLKNKENHWFCLGFLYFSLLLVAKVIDFIVLYSKTENKILLFLLFLLFLKTWPQALGPEASSRRVVLSFEIFNVLVQGPVTFNLQFPLFQGPTIFYSSISFVLVSHTLCFCVTLLNEVVSWRVFFSWHHKRGESMTLPRLG